MNAQKPNVALIFGGMGCERGVSIDGAPYLYSLIDRSRYNVIPILIHESGEATVASISSDGSVNPQRSSAHLYRMFGRGGIVADGDFTPIAMAFPLLHGNFGEDGMIQGALTEVGIPYAGCDISASCVALDKVYTKIIAEYLGIRTAKFTVLNGRATDNRVKAEATIGYPMFIKPASLGSSIGISKVMGSGEFDTAIERAGKGKILAEECIDIAYEAECAYFSAKNRVLITPPGGVYYKSGFYDYEKKYITGGAEVTDSIPITKEASDRLIEYSRLLAEALGLRHLSRIDFFISTDGEIIFNEINTMPGFTRHSLYPRLLKHAGLDPSEAIKLMIEDTLGET